MTKTKHCKCCDRVLTIEHLITEKVGGYELRICLECIIAAFEEVLKEDDGTLFVKSPSPSSSSSKSVK